MGAVPELTLVEWLRLSQYSLPGPNRTYSQGDTAPGWGCLVKPPLNTKSMSESSPQETPTHTYLYTKLLLRQPSTLPHPPRCSTINTTGLSSPGSKRILGVSPKLSPPQNHQTTTHPTKNGAQACCFKTIQRTQTNNLLV